MSISRKTKSEIKEFLLSAIYHKQSPYIEAEAEFSISRQTIRTYLIELENDGFIVAGKQKTNKQYALKDLKKAHFSYQNLNALSEDAIYKNAILPLLSEQTDLVKQKILYIFSEMVNNAIEHSGGDCLDISYFEDYFCINIFIADDGVGIFNKIIKDHCLANAGEVVFELKKGKLTSSPHRHSGEGIFFSSKASDLFIIYSGSEKAILSETSGAIEEYPLIDSVVQGSVIYFAIKKNTTVPIKEIFDKFTDEESYDFSKTEIIIRLAQEYEDVLMARSQARRILRRIEDFQEVVLDFKDVKMIGQGFADEVFRIFRREYPEIKVDCINQNADVLFMIERAKRAAKKESEANQQ